ncbi:MAG TPA: CDP-alcohol phosphatidyltransferase family protein [Chthoniobacterales bacterium]|nr:CDP-alcohol phosphatidyltransferase family protein [Chthoniobacterales bacterium]
METLVRQNDARTTLRRVLIVADESAHWKIAGLRQLDRLLLTLQEFAETQPGSRRINVCIQWQKNASPAELRQKTRLRNLVVTDCAEDWLAPENAPELVLSTRVFLYRNSLPALLETLPASSSASDVEAIFASATNDEQTPWVIVSSEKEIPAVERRFLRANGKSQDGLVSRYINRRISHFVSRWLLKTPITPSAWSILIFTLPLAACFAFVQGSYAGFVIGAAIFQLYSILDGCDGEIARARFQQTERGRKLDSFLDLLGNLLLALSLGIGLARQSHIGTKGDWFYISEGIATAIFIAIGEGMLFLRRSRGETVPALSARWHGTLYQRHQEIIEHSGILMLGERVAWWLMQLTKRDMSMLGFLLLALAGAPEWILHLQLITGAASSAMAGNAFLRQPAPTLAQEAS